MLPHKSVGELVDYYYANKPAPLQLETGLPAFATARAVILRPQRSTAAPAASSDEVVKEEEATGAVERVPPLASAGAGAAQAATEVSAEARAEGEGAAEGGDDAMGEGGSGDEGGDRDGVEGEALS